MACDPATVQQDNSNHSLAPAGDEESGLKPAPVRRSARDLTETVVKSQGKCACLRSRCCCKWSICCSCSAALLFILLWYAAVDYFARLATEQLVVIDEQKVREYCTSDLTPSNLTENMWWPGCGFISGAADLDGECGMPCYPSSLIRDMSAFNRDHPGQLVSFPSREQEGVETVTLRGWWLPPVAETIAEGGPAPRVVLQHGFRSNSNTFRQVIAAYMLRSLGFGVLVTNFRDHGYSDNSTARIVQWGHAYAFDTLGAWDYARNDPDGVLGSPRPSGQVPIFGTSMGGFATNNAFGLEADIPAVWVDSPPLGPYSVFKFGGRKQLDGMGIGFLGPLLFTPTWRRVLKYAYQRGVNIEEYLPEAVMPDAPDDKRPIYFVTNMQDDTVPYEEAVSLGETLEGLPGKYDVKGIWVNDASCRGTTHAADALRDFDGYRVRLCEFLFPALGLGMQRCQQLPVPDGPNVAR